MYLTRKVHIEWNDISPLPTCTCSPSRHDHHSTTLLASLRIVYTTPAMHAPCFHQDNKVQPCSQCPPHLRVQNASNAYIKPAPSANITEPKINVV